LIDVNFDKNYSALYSNLLWRRAELIVDHEWKAVEAVAAELLKHRTLKPDEVRAAIDRAHGLKPFPERVQVSP
jgi:hypothetical protein